MYKHNKWNKNIEKICECKDYSIIAKMFEENVSNPLRGKVDRHFVNKRSNPISSAIVNFLTTKKPFWKDHMHQKLFLEDMCLSIVKNHLPMQFVESLWMERLYLHLCQRLVFPSKK
jgi:hypothetical protein